MGMKNYFQGRSIWVTGASSGIGAAFVKEIARYHPRCFILSGRDQARLHAVASELSPCPVHVLPFDVTDDLATQAAVHSIQTVAGGVDIVFFNAGGSEHNASLGLDVQSLVRQMEQNYFSIVYGVNAVLPLLRLSSAPHIIGMSSVAAFLGIPQAEGYCAAKAAARIFLEALRVKLWTQKIPVTIICPGFIKTPLIAKNDFYMPFLMSSQRAARIIARAVAKKKCECVFPSRMKWLIRFLNLLPKRWLAFMMARARR